MNRDQETKVCRMCFREIPRQARKCPECHHFQSRATMLAYHPAVAVSLTALPMLIVFVLFARLFDAGEDYERYRDQIEVTDTELAFGLSGTNATVAVIGKIKNLSPVAWKDISLHATFFDAAAKTIDVGQRHEYSYYLPPNDVLPFKVSFRREFPESNYVNHAVRVIGAKDARARF
jgi:hypothetical protein